MLEYLWILIFVIEVDGLKAIGTGDRFIDESIFTITVGFSDSYFVHYASHLLLCVTNLGKADVEDHSRVCEFIAFLADFEDLVVLVKLVCREERLKDDAALGIAAES